MFLKSNTKKDIMIHLGVIVLIVLVMIFLFFSVYLPLTTQHGQSIKVPELKGKTTEQLEELLDKQDLRYQVNDSIFVAGAVPLSVISQHPLPGSEVKANRIIYITLTSKVPPMIPMPELKDKALTTAEMELKSRSLVLGEVKTVPDEFKSVKQQYVDGKEIIAGTLIPKGTVVTLEVGSGTPAADTTLTNTETEETDQP